MCDACCGVGRRARASRWRCLMFQQRFWGCVGLADAITMLTKATKKPKKPPSAYTLYMKDQLSSDKIYSEIPHTERFTLVGQRWKALGEDARAPFADEAARLKAEFIQANPPKPKKPLSAYMLYFKDQLSSDKIYSEIPFTERAKLTGQRWNALDENAKAPYAAEAARLKAEFV